MSIQISSNKSHRLPFIDWLRGVSILLMVIYHLCYDLDLFGYIDTAFGRGLWIPFRYVIVIGFLSLVGVSLVIAHYNKINWPNFKKRTIQLFVASVFVSGSGYFIAANKITVFGILQFILIASFLALALVRQPRLALVLGIIIFIIGHSVTSSMFNSFWLNWIGMAEVQRPALDYVPLFPWLGVVLIGVYVGHWFLSGNGRKLGAYTLTGHSNSLISKTHHFIEVIGQHSLVIYLVHQPMLFGAFYVLDFIK